jgi:cytoskeletal protein RodZ
MPRPATPAENRRTLIILIIVVVVIVGVLIWFGAQPDSTDEGVHKAQPQTEQSAPAGSRTR